MPNTAERNRLSPVIRNMTGADVERAGEILFRAFNGVSLENGYGVRMHNLKVATGWAWSILHYVHSEVLVAEVDHRVVGLCCLNPRGQLGNIGPVAVDPDFQGHAIGRELMRALLKRAEGMQSLRVIQEAFNRASFSLYYSLKFIPVANVLELCLNESAEQKPYQCNMISELSGQDLDVLYAYDSQRSTLDRREDLIYYARWGKVFVYREQMQLHGFLACLPNSEYVQLGPLFAEGEEEAICLFRHAMDFFKGQNCRTRVMAKDYLFVRTLNELGLKLHSINNLMVRGPWRPGQGVEAFGIFPDGA